MVLALWRNFVAMMANRRHISLALALCLVGNIHAQQMPQDSTLAEREDSLPTVVVRGAKESPLMRAIQRSIEAHKQPKVKTLGDVLNEHFPTLMDRILHPFAFKERRREKRRQRAQQILEEYDKTETPNQLLKEAIERQAAEDAQKK